MRLALFLILATAAAHAQPVAPPETTERIQGAHRIVVASAGVLGGAVAGIGTLELLDPVTGTLLGAPFVLVAIPVGATLMMQAVGLAVGAEAPALAVARDMMLGAGAGALTLAAGVGLGFLVEAKVFGNNDYVILGPLVGGVVGGVVGTVLLVRLSTRSFRMTPAALAAPTGERGVGVSLRIGL